MIEIGSATNPPSPRSKPVLNVDGERHEVVGPARPEPAPRSWIRFRLPMTSRSINEGHRTASQLELLFDLTFVIAIARIGAELAHSIADGHGTTQVVPFLQVFFAIWWAWMNFTWFASSYDNDDALYRLLTMVQMAGALLLAAGVPAAFNQGDYATITFGYLIMRGALVALWVRAAVECPPDRRTAFRYAGGIFILEVLWILRLLLAERGMLPAASVLPVFLGLVVLELAVPCWAERRDHTSWHPHHIAERYGLFAIILLGEGLLSASSSVPDMIARSTGRDLAVVAVAGFALVMELWWIYFMADLAQGLARHRSRAFLWGYAHYGLFAALAALGAGLEVAVQQAGGEIVASPTVAAFAVAIPVAALLCLHSVINGTVIGRLALRPAVAWTAAGVVLVAALGAELAGSAAAISAIAVVCGLVIILEAGDGKRSEMGATTRNLVRRASLSG